MAHGKKHLFGIPQSVELLVIMRYNGVVNGTLTDVVHNHDFIATQISYFS